MNDQLPDWYLAAKAAEADEADPLERIADALETIAQCLQRVSSHHAIRIDKLL